MWSWILILVFTTFLYSTVQSQNCAVRNPCDLGGYFVAQNGYSCSQVSIASVKCTCPGGYEINAPCRVCNRTDSRDNACHNTTGRLLQCLEINDYGTSYACFCWDSVGNPFLTTDSECAEHSYATLTSTSTTTYRTPAICYNGGEFIDGICHCPSGYAGIYCEIRHDQDLCNRVNCKNSGVCGIRSPRGSPEGVCLCRYGTWGDYCEITGTLGYCSSTSCLNGGGCRENLIGTTRHAYCFCPAGYKGVRCEEEYFKCPGIGIFTDTHMFDNGKYFTCTNVGGSTRLEQKSCPKGLRYNMNRGKCAY